MLNIPELVTITAPSYFKLVLSSIKDKSGNDIDITSTGLYFLFTDQYGERYKCLYDPFTENYENCYVEDETGHLILVFQNYKLRDRINVKTGTFIEDSHFIDGLWNSYDKFETIKLQIKYN